MGLVLSQQYSVASKSVKATLSASLMATKPWRTGCGIVPKLSIGMFPNITSGPHFFTPTIIPLYVFCTRCTCRLVGSDVSKIIPHGRHATEPPKLLLLLCPSSRISLFVTSCATVRPSLRTACFRLSSCTHMICDHRCLPFGKLLNIASVAVRHK